ncbi:MAG TPA: hypothetical protein VD793_00890 [Gemmatimonadales bacterium]|nr:hypothetical protein [Gemmatimonadales bacterium]
MAGTSSGLRCSTALTATALVMLGCASSGGAAGGDPTGRGSSVLTAEMLAAQPVTNLYDAVQRLRPRWMLERGTSTLSPGGNPVVVYVDNQRLGGVEELRGIPIHTVQLVRYRDASDATTRYGLGHASGAIEVIMKKSDV